MIFDILTLFPDYFDGFLADGVIARAVKRGNININIVNLRDFARDRHRITDDRPFGGGPGMVMKAEPIYLALEKSLPGRFRKTVKARRLSDGCRVILMSPQGSKFDHACAKRLASYKKIVLICGRYEGVDERIMDFVDEEISLGDFVLTGGEIPSMAVADAVARLSGGVVKETSSVENDSFFSGLLDCPHYTRPRVWRGREAPAAVLTGDHAQIEKWRGAMAMAATRKKRPDLLKKNNQKGKRVK